MKPRRIQLKRSKGWKIPPNTVIVDRRSKWGNPWRVGYRGIETAEQAVRIFREYMLGGGSGMPIEELRGKDLACWCSQDQPCHADVLLELANREK